MSFILYPKKRGLRSLISNKSNFKRTLFYFGKILAVVVLLTLLVDREIFSSIPSNWKVALGLISLFFACLGLYSAPFGFFRIMAVAGFWVIAIYFLTDAFLEPQRPAAKLNKYVSKKLPKGYIYQEFPDTKKNYLVVERKRENPLHSSKIKFMGVKDSLSQSLNLNNRFFSDPLGVISTFISTKLGNTANLSMLEYNSGVLPDSVYFPPNNKKRNFYPVDGSSSISVAGLLNVNSFRQTFKAAF